MTRVALNIRFNLLICSFDFLFLVRLVATESWRPRGTDILSLQGKTEGGDGCCAQPNPMGSSVLTWSFAYL